MCLYVHFLSLPKRCTKSDRLIKWVYFVHNAIAPGGPRPHYRGYTITPRHATLGRTPPNEWSARRRGDLTTHNQRQTYTPPARFEPWIPASDRPQTHALDRMATWIGSYEYYIILSICKAFKAQWSLCVPHSGHYMYHQFNIQQFYILPTQCIFFFGGSQNKRRLFPYTTLAETECSLRGTNWMFKCISA